jgi:5-hydroxyisourate hydrolase
LACASGHASRPTTSLQLRQVAIIGKLTTHVLDTAHGCPAAHMTVTLERVGSTSETLLSIELNDDGRASAALLEGDALTIGRYRLTFDVADYFRSCGVVLPDPPFLDRVPIEFSIADATANYHVPLLVSPWAYSTYRGS